MNLNYKKEAAEILPEMIETRRYLHMHPEVGFDTLKTESYIRERLEKMGIEVLPTEYGVVGIIRAEQATELIALRSDIDALDINEQNEVCYKSQVPGKMHACGHDGHMAMLLGAASILNRNRDKLAYDILLIFQPGEEGQGVGRGDIPASKLPSAGAKAMLPTLPYRERIKMIFGQHLFNDFPLGQIVLKNGPMMSSADQFWVDITGVSGHTSRLDRTVDALSVGCSFVKALESFVARQINPADPVVLSVGTFHSGTATNVVSGQASLSGTIRCQSMENRRRVFSRLDEILQAECAAMGARGSLRILEGVPVLENNSQVTAYARKKAIQAVGAEHVSDLPSTSMAAEDFSFYSQELPSTFIWLGSGNREKGFTVLGHNDRFDFDENALALGTEMWLRIATDAVE